MGNSFNKKSESEIKSFDDFSEKQNLIFTTSGNQENKTWWSDEKKSDFFMFSRGI
ncbi:MAG: hypothetical protein MZV64_04005 [Ignavibacteriales bacterium]|nr:hypothetical protein [Ignavibacteriales bacterium]